MPQLVAGRIVWGLKVRMEGLFSTSATLHTFIMSATQTRCTMLLGLIVFDMENKPRLSSSGPHIPGPATKMTLTGGRNGATCHHRPIREAQIKGFSGVA
jgi:hypothetical protein